MGRRYDDRRWIQNEDGSFTRRSEVRQAIEIPPDGTEAEIEGDGSGEALLPIVAGTGVEITYYAEEVNATAAAVKLAQELGVDLSQVQGSGLKGKITKPDVENAAA